MFEPTSSGAPRSSTTIRTASSAAPSPAGPSGPAAVQGGTSNAPYTPENEVHLLDRLAVLYRYRRLCVTVFILVTAAMIIQGYSAVKVYQAQARLLIEDERSTAVPGLQTDQNQFYEDPEPYYQTQYKILKGRDLMRRVVHKLHLEKVPEFNGTKPAPPTPTLAAQRSENESDGVFRNAGGDGPGRNPQDRRDRRRVGAGRQLHRPGRRRAGARHPPGRRHVRLRRAQVRGATR